MTDDTATAPATPATAPAVKPGWKTTEFWIHVIVALAGFVMASGLPSNSKIVQIAGLATSLASALGYTTSRTMIKNAAMILLPIFLVFSLSGCKTINKEALAAWTAGDQVIMQDLEDYRTAQGKPTDDIQKHLAKLFSEITAEEENALVSEALADVQNDPKKIAKRKTSYATRVEAHLNVFNSLKQ